MLKPLLAIVFGLFLQAGYCQEGRYLLLIDAENQRPFQLITGDLRASSSSLGHISIPNLKDSNYRIYIRFADHAIPEQGFAISINKRDQGFQLRSDDQGRWSLYNWQSRELTHALSGSDSSRSLEQGVRRSDPFARMMAAVVNDSAVMYNTYSHQHFEADSARIALQQKQADSAAAAVALQNKVVRPVRLTPRQRADSIRLAGVRKRQLTDSLKTADRLAIQHQADSLRAMVLDTKIRDSIRNDSLAAATRALAAVKPMSQSAKQRADSIRQQSLLRRQIADSLRAQQKLAKQHTADSLRAATALAKLQSDSTRAALAQAKQDAAKASKITQQQRIDSLKQVFLDKRREGDSLKLAQKLAKQQAADNIALRRKQETDSLKMLAAQRPAVVKYKKLTIQQRMDSLRQVSVDLKRKSDSLNRINDSLASIKPGRQNKTLVADKKDSISLLKSATAFKGSVKKIREVSLKVSRKIVFLDMRAAGVVDTITAFVYFDEKDTSAAARKTPAKKEGSAVCDQQAQTDDVDNARADILIANTEAEKIAAASKLFREVCFSTSQVRLLTGLFVSDQGKYKLIEAAYRHVWDPEHLNTLQDVFADKQFVRKFHTLVPAR